jgi:hypothetical protein
MACGGTGWWVLMKSWFHSDGYRRERCHICHGTGISDRQPSPDWIDICEEQRLLRERANAQPSTEDCAVVSSHDPAVGEHRRK